MIRLLVLVFAQQAILMVDGVAPAYGGVQDNYHGSGGILLTPQAAQAQNIPILPSTTEDRQTTENRERERVQEVMLMRDQLEQSSSTLRQVLCAERTWARLCLPLWGDAVGSSPLRPEVPLVGKLVVLEEEDYRISEGKRRLEFLDETSRPLTYKEGARKDQLSDYVEVAGPLDEEELGNPPDHADLDVWEGLKKEVFKPHNIFRFGKFLKYLLYDADLQFQERVKEAFKKDGYISYRFHQFRKSLEHLSDIKILQLLKKLL